MPIHYSMGWIIPFALLLLSIALLPLLAPHFWEKNRNRAIVCFTLAAPTAVLLILRDPNALYHSAEEYFSFIALLGSLFVISGGILFDTNLKARASTNTAILAIGTFLASLIGTTGASMLLIRPLLKMNQNRKTVKHLPIFFIFTVSNIGGLLTPIGDPPLFLGFLRGVPFFWTLKLFPIWVLLSVILLVMFYFVDRYFLSKENLITQKTQSQEPRYIKLRGGLNFILLAGVVAGVFLPTPYREFYMLGLAILSLIITKKEVRKANHFTYHPIIEVAVLFAGIFVAMVPALEILKANAPSFGLQEPYQFFWLTGILSAFLDNAPTYLTFFSMAQGLEMPGPTIVGVTEPILYAISAGAVLMGALSYIGNGPNFMVKAISDELDIETPSFFGYLAYSFAILGPLFILVSFLFL